MNSDRSAPVDVAARFVEAIAWGEHTVVWELLSPTGRSTAVSVALARGLDRVIASRIVDNVADPAELDEFLRRLLHGLRRDLRSVDVAEIKVVACDVDDRSAIAHLITPSTIPGTDAWAAGRVVMAADDAGRWAIDRLEPVIAGP
ncbi:MAG: hypothetical protein HKN41_09980 [Ilumatobacter sp.]|nr:hypothetical protein [Ilumatobacter sp.]